MSPAAAAAASRICQVYLIFFVMIGSIFVEYILYIQNNAHIVCNKWYLYLIVSQRHKTYLKYKYKQSLKFVPEQVHVLRWSRACLCTGHYRNVRSSRRVLRVYPAVGSWSHPRPRPSSPNSVYAACTTRNGRVPCPLNYYRSPRRSGCSRWSLSSHWILWTRGTLRSIRWHCAWVRGAAGLIRRYRECRTAPCTLWRPKSRAYSTCGRRGGCAGGCATLMTCVACCEMLMNLDKSDDSIKYIGTWQSVIIAFNSCFFSLEMMRLLTCASKNSHGCRFLNSVLLKEIHWPMTIFNSCVLHPHCLCVSSSFCEFMIDHHKRWSYRFGSRADIRLWLGSSWWSGWLTKCLVGGVSESFHTY